MLKLSELAFDDVACLLLTPRFRVLLQTQQLNGVGNRSQWTSQFMAEHRQKLILAKMQIGQLRGLYLQQLLQTAAFCDVANVALNDLMIAFSISVGDNFYFDSNPACDSRGRCS
jgi:hypothetical protein